MRVANDTIIAAPIDLSSDWTSDAIPLLYLDNYSIQVIFTGTLTGVWFLEISTDKTDPENWTLFTGSDQQIVEAGDHTWNVQGAGHNFVRVVWQNLSGNGTLTSARFNAKGT